MNIGGGTPTQIYKTETANDTANPQWKVYYRNVHTDIFSPFHYLFKHFLEGFLTDLFWWNATTMNLLADTNS